MEVTLASPPGVRSCRQPDGTPGQGGYWDRCKLLLSSHADDFTACTQHLTPHARAFLAAEIRNMRARATTGELHLQRPGDDQGEVVLSHHRPRILEMRFTKQRGDEGEQHTRLYYTEPNHEHGLLLHLSLAWKRPGPMGLAEQDGHMRQADRRLDHHYGVTNL